MLCYWRDRGPDALGLFKTLADDDHPRVRLEAVRAASFFRTADAADAALIALKHPTDYYLDYTLHETLRQLEPWWRRALETGQPLAADNPAGQRLLLQTINTPELLKLPRSPMILQAVLTRADAPDADRMVALGDLAKVRNTNLVAALLTEIDANLKTEATKAASNHPALTADYQSAVSSLARLLPYQIPEKLKAVCGRLSEFTTNSASADLRQNAWAASALADGSFDLVWSETSKSPAARADLLNGIPLPPDPDFRAKAYGKVKVLVEERGTGKQPAAGASDLSNTRRAAIRALTSMNYEPEATFSALTDLIVRGEEVAAAAQGLRVIPRPKWPRDQAGTAATGLVAWAKTIPASERTSQEYGETVQLAEDLAGLLPAEKAAGLRKELRDLRVALFVIRTVREQMRYDTPRLVVEAGKPFEIIFENADFMPHNLLVVKPDTREKVGLEAANMKPEELDSEGRAYVPRSSDILAASKLLQPGQRQSLRLTAPSVEGAYEYVCTFPGHYQVMWGRLVVTKDVEAYLQTHPEAPLPTPSPTALSEDGTGGAAHAHTH